jgi:hypothetical protein
MAFVLGLVAAKFIHVVHVSKFSLVWFPGRYLSLSSMDASATPSGIKREMYVCMCKFSHTVICTVIVKHITRYLVKINTQASCIYRINYQIYILI